VEQYPANNPSQDRFHVVVEAASDATQDDTCFFGLYDGHLGDQVSSFLDDNMHSAVFRSLDLYTDPADSLKDAYITIDKMWMHHILNRFQEGEVDLATVGSCALVVVVKGGKLHAANLGDSRATLINVADNGHLEAVDLTVDQNVENELEIRNLHERHPDEPGVIVGRHGQKRVKGLLKVTRAIGDLYLKDASFNCLPLPPLVQVKEPYKPPYIYNEPEVETATLDHRARFLLLASDGLWENLSKPEVLSAMEEAMVSHDVSVEFIPAQLIKMALERAAERHNVGIVEMLSMSPNERRNFHDDITVILVYLPYVFNETHSVQRHFRTAMAASTLAETLTSVPSSPKSDRTVDSFRSNQARNPSPLSRLITPNTLRLAIPRDSSSLGKVELATARSGSGLNSSFPEQVPDSDTDEVSASTVFLKQTV